MTTFSHTNNGYEVVQFNNDGSVMSQEEIMSFRERQGFCTTCTGAAPVQCYAVRRNRFMPVKEPLTQVGRVYKGICLFCHPEKDPRFSLGGGDNSRSNNNDYSNPSNRSSPQDYNNNNNNNYVIAECAVVDARKEDSTSLSGTVHSEASGDAELKSFKDLIEEICTESGVECAVDLILSALGEISSSPRMLEYALMKLWELSRNQERNKELILQKEGPTFIIRVMQQHATSKHVQEKACGALWTLAVSKETRSSVAHSGACKAVLHALKGHESSVKVVTTVFGALRTLSTEDYSRHEFLNEHGAKAVANAMTKHSASVQIQKDGCAILSNSVVDTRSQSVSKASTEEFKAILSAMSNHPNHPAVQRAGCFALKNYIFDDENARVLRLCATNLNVILKTARNLDACQEDAEAILNRLELSKTEDASMEALARSSIEEVVSNDCSAADAVETIIDLLDRYRWSDTVVGTGLDAFSILLPTRPEAAGSIAQVRTLQLMLDVMSEYSDRVILQEKCCQIFSLLAETSREYRYALIDATVFQRLISTLKNHADKQSVVEHVFAVLDEISKERECSVYISVSDIMFLQDVIMEYQHKPGLCYCGNRIVSNLQDG